MVPANGTEYDHVRPRLASDLPSHLARLRDGFRSDRDGPHGEVFGSSVAHAEINVLSRLEFRRYRDLVLTTTLQPCLQCAGAIRLARIGTVRYAGHDAYWDGYHDFGKLAEREGRRRTAGS